MRKILCLFTILLMTATAHAGLTVIPSRMEVLMAPGEKATGKYTVRNDYDTPVEITMEYRDWYVLPANREKGIEIADWLKKVYPSEFRLMPGEVRDVQYDIELPKETEGTLVGMVSFVPQTEETSGVTLVVSVSLYVTARGTEKTDWQFEEVKVQGTAEKAEVIVNVKNDGNIHLRPTGTATLLKDGIGVGELSFVEGRPVYPGNSRIHVARGGFDTPLAPGKYVAKVKMNGGGLEKETTVSFTVKSSGEIENK